MFKWNFINKWKKNEEIDLKFMIFFYYKLKKKILKENKLKKKKKDLKKWKIYIQKYINIINKLQKYIQNI